MAINKFRCANQPRHEEPKTARLGTGTRHVGGILYRKAPHSCVTCSDLGGVHVNLTRAMLCNSLLTSIDHT